MKQPYTANETVTPEEFAQSGAWGMSASIDLKDCDPKQLTTPELIRAFILDLVKCIGMQAHGEPMIEQFGKENLKGYSVLQFIETSSITIHFDDKLGNRAMIDIFSCKFFDVEEAKKFCVKQLGGTITKTTVLFRG